MNKKAIKTFVKEINQIMAGDPVKTRKGNRKTLFYLVRDRETMAVRDRLSVKATDVENGANQVMDFVIECAKRGQKYPMTTQQALRKGFTVKLIKAPKEAQSIELLRHQLASTGKIDAYAN